MKKNKNKNWLPIYQKVDSSNQIIGTYLNNNYTYCVENGYLVPKERRKTKKEIRKEQAAELSFFLDNYFL